MTKAAYPIIGYAAFVILADAYHFFRSIVTLPATKSPADTVAE